MSKVFGIFEPLGIDGRPNGTAIVSRDYTTVPRIWANGLKDVPEGVYLARVCQRKPAPLLKSVMSIYRVVVWDGAKPVITRMDN